MGKIRIPVIIIFCVLLAVSISYGSKKRRRTTSTKSTTAKKTTERKTPSRGKISKVRKVKKSGRKLAGKTSQELFHLADSSLSSGDTAYAIENLANIIDYFPDDSLAPKASILLAKCYLNQGKTKDARNVLSPALGDSNYAPQAELLSAKIYAAEGQYGYALLLARKTQVKYYFNDVGKEAGNFANSLVGKIAPIIPQTTQENKPQQDTTQKTAQ